MDTVTTRPVERPGFGTADAAIDRRRHRRVSITLPGRCMRADKQEFACKLVDVSVGGAAMHCSAEVEIGERIVATFDHIGCIEGHVVRRFAGGFAIELQATQHKRDKLAGQITWLMNRHELGDTAEARRHERIAIANSKQAMLKLDEGITIPVDVIDFSMSGASIATKARPPIGHAVQIGKLKGKVVRHHSEGIGIEFLSIQSQESVPANLELRGLKSQRLSVAGRFEAGSGAGCE
jgi:hypothetical protein